jgi:hypothetical protein
LWRQARARCRRAVELLETVGKIGPGSSPVPDREAEAGDSEQRQEHEDLATRVEAHERTIPRRTERD